MNWATKQNMSFFIKEARENYKLNSQLVAEYLSCLQMECHPKETDHSHSSIVSAVIKF